MSKFNSTHRRNIESQNGVETQSACIKNSLFIIMYYIILN